MTALSGRPSRCPMLPVSGCASPSRGSGAARGRGRGRASGGARGAGPATIDTIGPSHSGVPAGSADRPACERERVAASSETTIERGVEVVAQPREQRDQIGLGRARRGRRARTGTPGSTQRQRTVLEVGRGVRVGEDLRQLLELERPLARGRVLVAAGEDEQPGRRRPGRRRSRSMSGSSVERRGDRVRDRGQRPPRSAGVVGQRGRQQAIASSSAV